DDDNGNASGSAYLFDATSGALLVKLTAPDGAEGDEVGISVALDGGLALIGAWGDDNGGGTDAGAAYLFDVSAFIPEPASAGLLAAAGLLLTRRRA
ncbi:MAG: FG-GAP repeat protein, partial [Phycisphaerae bacterium]